MRESEIQRLCMLALSDAGCVVLRSQVGTFYTKDGRPVRVGVVGHSDLYGVRPDGRAYFVETKTRYGRLRPEQSRFLEAMRACGAVAIVARDHETVVRDVMGG